MSVKDKTLRRPQQIVLLRDGGTGSSTLSSAVAAGATTFDVASATGLTAGDAFRIDTGEDVEFGFVQSVSSNTITPKKPLLKAHASGIAVVEQVAYDLGQTQGGVQLSGSLETTDESSDMQRLVVTVMTGFSRAGLSTTLLGHTLYYWCVVLGIPFTSVTGSKTTSAPLVLATDFNDVDSVTNQSLALASVLNDGSFLLDELHGVNVDYTGISVNLARGVPGVLPVKAACYGRRVARTLAAGSSLPWTADASKAAAKDEVYAAMSSLGFWSATGTPTTVFTAASAGATTLIVADGSGFAAEDWILVNSGGLVETHWILSKATNTLTLKTPLKRAQAVGVRVVKGLQNLFTAVQKGGATFTIGGSSTDDYIETRQLSCGKTPGGVAPSFAFNIRDLTLANFCSAAGIPSSAIASSSVILSELLATAAVEALFLYGTLQNGVTHLMNLWGCSQDLANFLITYNGQSPDQSVLPFLLKPTSGVQWLQYA